jgi:hypothetical protein
MIELMCVYSWNRCTSLVASYRIRGSRTSSRFTEQPKVEAWGVSAERLAVLREVASDDKCFSLFGFATDTFLVRLRHWD